MEEETGTTRLKGHWYVAMRYWEKMTGSLVVDLVFYTDEVAACNWDSISWKW